MIYTLFFLMGTKNITTRIILPCLGAHFVLTAQGIQSWTTHKPHTTQWFERLGIRCMSHIDYFHDNSSYLHSSIFKNRIEYWPQISVCSSHWTNILSQTHIQQNDALRASDEICILLIFLFLGQFNSSIGIQPSWTKHSCLSAWLSRSSLYMQI